MLFAVSVVGARLSILLFACELARAGVGLLDLTLFACPAVAMPFNLFWLSGSRFAGAAAEMRFWAAGADAAVAPMKAFSFTNNGAAKRPDML